MISLKRDSSFTLVEVLIVAFLFIIILGGILSILAVGRDSWYQTDVEIELQQDLRKAMTRVTKELRESGFNSAGAVMVTIQDGAGVNNSDILSFYVPVDHDNDGDILDDSANIQWGAPILWANKDPNCEGAGDTCQYLDYKIEYLINDNSQFIRRVLDNNNATVREDLYANNIVDFQLSRSTDFVSLGLTARKDTVFGRTITQIISSDLYLRNRG
jgi:type II secretory pathway pseudopilin PulG